MILFRWYIVENLKIILLTFKMVPGNEDFVVAPGPKDIWDSIQTEMKNEVSGKEIRSL